MTAPTNTPASPALDREGLEKLHRRWKRSTERYSALFDEGYGPLSREVRRAGEECSALYTRLTAELVANVPAILALLPSPPVEDRGAAERLKEALTPSAATKAAYIGEFSFNVVDRDEDGDEIYRSVRVPWDTIKEIMAAIRARALPAQPTEGEA